MLFCTLKGSFSITQNAQFIYVLIRGGSSIAATSTMERFVIIVNGFHPLNITKRSILDVISVLDPPLMIYDINELENGTQSSF